ncbi:MAG: hypothetical protein ACJA2S_002531 [Cyclobacteriaceae bacterium]|jgi:hypothetical protein
MAKNIDVIILIVVGSSKKYRNTANESIKTSSVDRKIWVNLF